MTPASAGTVHVVGAGLAGLSAAVALRAMGRPVVLHEASGHAGGRCRSYADPELGITVDNGSHLILNGNDDALGFLRTVHGGEPPLETVSFHFREAGTGRRWTVRPNEGRLPWWVLRPGRRAPDTTAKAHLALARLLRAPPTRPIGTVVPTDGPLWTRFLRPVLLAALNTEPDAAACGYAATILRESLLRGGAQSRPLFAAAGLGAVFVEPALRWLAARGVAVHMHRRLRRLEFGSDRVKGLDFGSERIAVMAGEAVVLATPGWTAAELIPGLCVPTAQRAIVNIHYRCPRPSDLPTMTGMIGTTGEWLFAHADHLSVTISAADRHIGAGHADLARTVWADVGALVPDVPTDVPPFRVVMEKRATFAALPESLSRRPSVHTCWQNLALAGDWTDTRLPSTIEGAVRSGRMAARAILRTVPRAEPLLDGRSVPALSAMRAAA